MAKFSFERWLARSANVATFWPLIPAGIIGVLAGIFSRGVAAINAYGPFGWLMAGLVAFLLAAAAIFMAAAAYDRFAIARAKQKWARDVDQVNPLDPEFNRKRLKLTDLVHPASGRIVSKRFVDCQLLGPANIVMLGEGLFSHTGFINCDFVIHPDQVFIGNAIVLQDCDVLNGEIIRCTVFVDQQFYDANFAPLGVNLVSYRKPPEEEQNAGADA